MRAGTFVQLSALRTASKRSDWSQPLLPCAPRKTARMRSSANSWGHDGQNATADAPNARLHNHRGSRCRPTAPPLVSSSCSGLSDDAIDAAVQEAKKDMFSLRIKFAKREVGAANLGARQSRRESRRGSGCCEEHTPWSPAGGNLLPVMRANQTL